MPMQPRWIVRLAIALWSAGGMAGCGGTPSPPKPLGMEMAVNCTDPQPFMINNVQGNVWTGTVALNAVAKHKILSIRNPSIVFSVWLLHPNGSNVQLTTMEPNNKVVDPNANPYGFGGMDIKTIRVAVPEGSWSRNKLALDMRVILQP